MAKNTGRGSRAALDPANGGERLGYPDDPLPSCQYPPVKHSDGTVTLWHNDSPGARVRVKPCLARRLGLIRGSFATTSEIFNMYKERK